MAFNFYMPDIGEGVVEGEIVGWKVKEGDKVKLDQPLVEVMTDKATVELPSPRAGTIAKINYKDGDICPVGKILVVIEDGDGGTSVNRGSNGDGAKHVQQVDGSSTVPIQVVDATRDRERVLATPATRRL